MDAELNKSLREIAAEHYAKDPLGHSLDLDIAIANKYLSQNEHNDCIIKSNDGGFAFQSRDVRDSLAVEFHYTKARQAIDSSQVDVFELIHLLFTYDASIVTSLVGKVFALVHHETDVFKLAIDAFPSVNAFTILRCIGAALNHIEDLDVEQLCRVVSAQAAYTNRDYLEGDFFNAISTAINNRPNVCIKILNFLRDSIDLANIRVYQIACVSLMSSDPSIAERVVRDHTSDSVLLKHAATVAAGSLLRNVFLDKEKVDALTAIVWKSFGNGNEELKDAAMFAMGMNADSITEFDCKLLDCAKAGDKSALMIMSRASWLALENALPPSNIEEKLLVLSKHFNTQLLDASYLDYILRDLLTDSTCFSTVLTCLDICITNAANGTENEVEKLLPTTISHIMQNPLYTSTFITRLLLSSQLELPLAINSIVGFERRKEEGAPELKFDLSLVGELDLPAFSQLVASISTFVIDSAIQLSLAFSLLELSLLSFSQLEIVAEFLRNEFSYEYPGCLIDKLDEIKEQSLPEAVQRLCEALRQNIETKYESRGKLEIIPELQVSSLITTSIQETVSKSMQRQMRLAESKSALRKLVTTIPVKAGLGFFSSQINDPNSPSEASKITVIRTTPRSLQTDIVGIDLRRSIIISCRNSTI